MVRGHNRGDERWGYKRTLAHCRQVQELTVSKGQPGVSAFVACRTASNGSLVDVPRTGFFSICCCQHCSRSQSLALIVSVYSTGIPLRLEGYGVFGPTLGKGTGCSVPSRWRRQQISSVKVEAYRSSLLKVTRRGQSMSTSGRSSVSADMSGISLPASSWRAAGSCDSSASPSLVGSDSSCSGLAAGSVSNWRAGSESTSTSGSFPTELLFRSGTYRWSYG